MKVGVIGGAGYIGTHVVLELLEKGHSVVVLDDFSSGSRENIQKGLPVSHYKLIENSIGSEEGLSSLFAENPEILFHFAASKAAGESMIDPAKYSRNNVRNSFSLIEKMASSQCRRIVFSSTAAVYGDPQYLPVDEKHPLKPVNYYGFTKKAIEENLQWYSSIKGVRYAALRYFNAAGYDIKGRVRGMEKSPADLLPVVMEAASGRRNEMDVFGWDYPTPDGTCIRDYIHVSDLAVAHVMAMDYLVPEDRDLVVNLGSGCGLSVKQILEATEKIIGKPVPFRRADRRAGDPPHLVASARKAEEILGWRAEHSSAETLIQSMWELYRS